jgi:hypothetical protein
MVRLLHEGVCWLLSAVLLLNNGWPIAIRHAHDVGDNPYYHSHRLDRAASAPTAATLSDATGTVAGVTDHVHLLWLGWELVVLSPKGCRPSSCPSATAAGMLPQHAEKISSDRHALTAPNMQILAAIAHEPVSFADVLRRTSDSVLHIAALPLCETARHLRSGVQLS